MSKLNPAAVTATRRRPPGTMRRERTPRDARPRERIISAGEADALVLAFAAAEDAVNRLVDAVGGALPRTADAWLADRIGTAVYRLKAEVERRAEAAGLTVCPPADVRGRALVVATWRAFEMAVERVARPDPEAEAA